jgi:hypothetical protein
LAARGGEIGGEGEAEAADIGEAGLGQRGAAAVGRRLTRAADPDIAEAKAEIITRRQVSFGVGDVARAQAPGAQTVEAGRGGRSDHRALEVGQPCDIDLEPARPRADGILAIGLDNGKFPHIPDHRHERVV